MAAFNIMAMMVSQVRTGTTYSAKRTKAHDLVHPFLKQSAELDPRADGFVEVVFDPIPTGRDSKALDEVCELLTATETVFPGTDRVLCYRVKSGKASG